MHIFLHIFGSQVTEVEYDEYKYEYREVNANANANANTNVNINSAHTIIEAQPQNVNKYCYIENK